MPAQGRKRQRCAALRYEFCWTAEASPMRSCTTRRAPSAGSPRRRVHEGGSNNGLLDARALSSTEPARLYDMRAYDIDAWPSARAKERGRPEQCQLRGGGARACR